MVPVCCECTWLTTAESGGSENRGFVVVNRRRRSRLTLMSVFYLFSRLRTRLPSDMLSCVRAFRSTLTSSERSSASAKHVCDLRSTIYERAEVMVLS